MFSELARSSKEKVLPSKGYSREDKVHYGVKLGKEKKSKYPSMYVCLCSDIFIYIIYMKIYKYIIYINVCIYRCIYVCVCIRR